MVPQVLRGQLYWDFSPFFPFIIHLKLLCCCIFIVWLVYVDNLRNYCEAPCYRFDQSNNWLLFPQNSGKKKISPLVSFSSSPNHLLYHAPPLLEGVITYWSEWRCHNSPIQWLWKDLKLRVHWTFGSRRLIVWPKSRLSNGTSFSIQEAPWSCHHQKRLWYKVLNESH